MDGAGIVGGGREDGLGHLAGDLVHHRLEQRRLVGEVEIERATRDAGGRDDLLRAGFGEAFGGEQRAGRGDELRTGLAGFLSLPRWDFLHTYYLYVIFRLDTGRLYS